MKSISAPLARNLYVMYQHDLRQQEKPKNRCFDAVLAEIGEVWPLNTAHYWHKSQHYYGRKHQKEYLCLY